MRKALFPFSLVALYCLVYASCNVPPSPTGRVGVSDSKQKDTRMRVPTPQEMHRFWVRTIGGKEHQTALFVCIDNKNNIYVAGDFESELKFPFGVKKGNYDIFVLKMNSEGEYCWVRRIGGKKYDEPLGLCVDHDGNVYLLGYYNGKANFSSDFPNCMPDVHSSKVCITKISSSGRYCWTLPLKLAGTALDICLRPDGKAVYVAGQHVFETALVACVTTNGKIVWVKTAGMLGLELEKYPSAEGICVDSKGNMYICGSHGHIVGVAFGGADRSKYDKGGAFIAKMDSHGNLCWQRTVDRGKSSGRFFNILACRRIATYKEESVYVAGTFRVQGTVDFASGFLNTSSDVKEGNGKTGVFVMKVSSTGEYKWTRVFRPISKPDTWSPMVRVINICIDDEGSAYLVGLLRGECNFAEDFHDAAKDTKRSNDRMAFICKINPDGTYGWTKQVAEHLDSLSISAGADICLTKDGSAYVAVGIFSERVDFGRDFGCSEVRQGDVDVLSSDIFIVKIPRQTKLPHQNQ